MELTADEKFRQMQQAAELARQRDAYAKARENAKPTGVWDAIENIWATGGINKPINPMSVPADQRIDDQKGRHQFGR